MFRRHGRDRRSGNYIVMVALALVGVLAMGALAVDVSYIRFAQGQCQDVADAATQAAVLVLRNTGDLAQAEDAAEKIVAANYIAGGYGTIQDIQFGVWDDTTTPGTFTATEIYPNAAYIEVGRVDSNSVGMFLAQIFGWEQTAVRASAISATRSLQVMLVMDITNSWQQQDFKYARDAVLAFYTVIAESHSDHDLVGMVIFNYSFAWEYTPFTLIKDDTGEIATDWGKLNEASQPGTDSNPDDGVNCSFASNRNDFSTPTVGGCYPDMPRRYSDEGGTDHSVGLQLTQTLFDEAPAPASYKAVVVLTDGYPNQIPTAPSNRYTYGYSETRWREHIGTIPHYAEEIIADTQALTEAMYDDDRIHTWVVSFVADQPFLHDWPQGNGYFAVTNSANALVDIMEDVALSMPVAIVQ